MHNRVDCPDLALSLSLSIVQPGEWWQTMVTSRGMDLTQDMERFLGSSLIIE